MCSARIVWGHESVVRRWLLFTWTRISHVLNWNKYLTSPDDTMLRPTMVSIFAWRPRCEARQGQHQNWPILAHCHRRQKFRPATNDSPATSVAFLHNFLWLQSSPYSFIDPKIHLGTLFLLLQQCSNTYKTYTKLNQTIQYVPKTQLNVFTTKSGVIHLILTTKSR